MGTLALYTLKLGTFNDIISLLCKVRKENYTFQKHALKLFMSNIVFASKSKMHQNPMPVNDRMCNNNWALCKNV